MEMVELLLCCLPTPLTHTSWGGRPIFPHVVHQTAPPSICPAVLSLRMGLSIHSGCKRSAVEEMVCVAWVCVTKGSLWCWK